MSGSTDIMIEEYNIGKSEYMNQHSLEEQLFAPLTLSGSSDSGSTDHGSDIDVVIIGPFGIGKSTLCGAIQSKLGHRMVKEPLPDVTLLDEFYKTPKKTAFHIQMEFFFNRCSEWERHQNQSNSHVFDTSPFSDTVYARTQIAEGNMSQREYATYRKYYEEKCNQYYNDTSVLFIYLSANPSTCLERIRIRNNSYETGVSDKYITALCSEFETFYGEISQRFFTVKVDWGGEVNQLDTKTRKIISLLEALKSDLIPNKGRYKKLFEMI